MKTNRKKTRKFLFQKLYTRSFGEFDEKLFVEHFYTDIFSFTLDDDYLDEMYNLVINKETYLINIIKKYAPKFDIQSMNYAIILPTFIALTEMLFLREELPSKISINEAIELTKVFGDESSKKIVNGILNNFYKEIEKYKDIEKDDKLGKSNYCFFK